MNDLNYKENILQQIEERNKVYGKFSELISSHAKLYEDNKELHRLNLKFEEDIETLKQEKIDFSSKVHSGAPGVDRNEKQTAALEQKLFKLQEELTEVHRSKGARAQQIIDLNVALQEKEREVTIANQLWKEKDNEAKTAKKQFLEMEQLNLDLKQANQMVNDEYQALQITYESIEGKLRCCQLENRKLMEHMKHQERKLTDALNSKNDEDLKILKNRAASDNSNEIRKDPDIKRKESSDSLSSSGNPTTSPPAPTFKDRISTFFGGKKPVQEEEPRYSHFLTQCSVIVRTPQEVLCKWKAHENEVTATKFFLSGGHLATGGTDKFIHTWNFVGDKARLDSTFRGCNGGVTNIDLDPQEEFIAASSTDHACRIWGVHSQRLKLTVTGHKDKVLSNCFLGSSHRLASGGADRTVKVWDVSSGACKQTFMAFSTCTDIICADSVECLASGHFNKKVMIWDARTGSQAQSEIVVGGRVTSLDMPVDKSLLVCCTKDHTLELIDLRKASVLTAFSDDAFRVLSDTTRCAFSPDGQYVSAGSTDGSVLSWDVKSGKLESNVRVHSDPVISCNWSGGKLVTGDKKGFSIVWTES